ncbi:MAG: hypothetical protein HKN92_00555, partial [Chitinophagales bacterium]|nr:hypothetical protein [Chitinophagales bacterium]
ISRFFPFSSNQGPYDRISTYYRGSYETVEIKFDSTGNNKKFNTIEFQAKYKLAIGKKHMYLFYFGSLNSVQSTASFIPQMNNKSWVRMHYHELEGHFQILPKTFLSMYYGFQRSIGNAETNLDTETLRARDQKDRAIGIGLNIEITQNTGLYLRHRWFKHQDLNFGEDLLQGKESIFELKTFF